MILILQLNSFITFLGLHILVYFISFVSGIVNTYSFGKLLHGFGFNCILFANISFDAEKTIAKQNSTMFKSIDFIHTEWGSQKLCDFCFFTKLMIVIFAFIWATFFIINSKGGKGNPMLGYVLKKMKEFSNIILNNLIQSM